MRALLTKLANFSCVYTKTTLRDTDKTSAESSIREMQLRQKNINHIRICHNTDEAPLGICNPNVIDTMSESLGHDGHQRAMGSAGN